VQGVRQVAPLTGLTSTSGGYLHFQWRLHRWLDSGYLVVEVCYIQPDEAPGYEDIDGYLLGRTVS
jgi:hypothetical protein